jgi:hypothetical protein
MERRKKDSNAGMFALLGLGAAAVGFAAGFVIKSLTG